MDINLYIIGQAMTCAPDLVAEVELSANPSAYSWNKRPRVFKNLTAARRYRTLLANNHPGKKFNIYEVVHKGVPLGAAIQ